MTSRPGDSATSPWRTFGRLTLGAFLVFAGLSHLTFGRNAFHAQIPPWLPLNADFVIIASGVIEIALGTTALLTKRWRAALGWLLTAFFVAVFPGNVSQFLTHTSAFGLDTDASRAIRLFFQPLLVMWALWCTGAWSEWRRSDARRP